jgi:hypothetical protein
MNDYNFRHEFTTQLNTQSLKPLLVHECKVKLLKISGQPSCSATNPIQKISVSNTGRIISCIFQAG